jgi:hypothetical protein
MKKPKTAGVKPTMFLHSLPAILGINVFLLPDGFHFIRFITNLQLYHTTPKTALVC